jgi:hypothetical protein
MREGAPMRSVVITSMGKAGISLVGEGDMLFGDSWVMNEG